MVTRFYRCSFCCNSTVFCPPLHFVIWLNSFRCFAYLNWYSFDNTPLLDQIYGSVTSWRCRSLGPMVGNGAVATFQKIWAEYLHAVMAPPLCPPIREPNLSKYVYGNAQDSLDTNYKWCCKLIWDLIHLWVCNTWILASDKPVFSDNSSRVFKSG